MNNKEFKKIFGNIAKLNGFLEAFGGWYKESEECIAVIELQKSSFGNNYYVNIKVFIQDLFGKRYTLSKDVIKSPMGDIIKQLRDLEVLNVDNMGSDTKNNKEFNDLFLEVICPFIDTTLFKADIRKSFLDGNLMLLPAVRDKLFMN